MMSKSIIVFMLCAVVFSLSAQTYTPENLGPGVNSTYDDINPVMSPDETTLFFVRVNHPSNTYGAEDSEDIWYSTLQSDGTWSEGRRIPELNIGRYNAVMSISPDGNTVLLSGVFNKRGTIWKKRGLSISTRSGQVWSTPEKIKIQKLSKRNRGLKSSGMMTRDEKYIILSFSRGYNSKKSNLFLCVKNEKGKWERPRPVKQLNSNGSEDTPFLTSDYRTLYFSSDYESPGNYELYKTTQTGTDLMHWSKPEKLADVNSPGWEGYYNVNDKGSVAYFSSTKNAVGGADIFRIKLFEDNPFIIVSGRLLHAETREPFNGANVSILVNETSPDSVEMNRDSATYKLFLPLNRAHTLKAKLENFDGIPERIDAKSEHVEIVKDLLLRPLPYVMVKGKLLDADNRAIPADAKPRVLINGMPGDSVTIDTLRGEYSVKLNHGLLYTLKVEADGYSSAPVDLDLTPFHNYTVVNQDLRSSRKVVAIPVPTETKPQALTHVVVTGKILDSRTGKGLDTGIPVTAGVDGLPGIAVNIDPVTRDFEVQLPVGKNFTLSAHAENYYPEYESINLMNYKGQPAIYRDLVVAPIEVGQLVRLNNVFFETGRSSLKKESFPELNRIAEFLKEHPNIRVEIGGHTDNVGSAPFNQQLSEARAHSVMTYVVSKGVSSSRLSSKGYGLTKPTASNNTVEGRARNRRVEFAILNK